jgi:GntR family transcriptional regulator, transcriptional repressor for pyruvate dehydrogenase complex
MTRINFQPLNVRRLSEMVEDSIKDLILTRQLQVGSKMPSESEISKQFGVSIVTVREALRGLEAFGIIERRRGKNGGTFIADTNINVAKSAMHYFLTSKKLSAEHLNQVRSIIEPATVALAASSITEEELEDLANNIKYCSNKINLKKSKFTARDFFDIEERQTEFHRLIADATHNPLLSLAVDYTLDFLAGFEKSSLLPDLQYSIDSNKDHEDILKDLRNGDVKSAEHHMLQHVRNVGDYLTSKENLNLKSGALKHKKLSSTRG